jgi:hypothetical protein
LRDLRYFVPGASYLAIVLQGVDFVVSDETFNGEPILSVVPIMELVGVLSRKAEVIFEELVCCPVSEGRNVTEIFCESF